MPAPAPVDQFAREVIRVDVWEPDDEFPYLPLGQKPKRVLLCPTPAPQPYLIAGHRYLFKEPRGRSAGQIWTEVIANRIGCAVGVEVPPAYVAYDGRLGSPGVLIEFFFGDGARRDLRFVHARDRFQASGLKLDERRGSLRDNLLLSRLHRVPEARSWWAQTVAFDTLIGNTDRHSENWGFLVRQPYGGEPTYEMAPAFDNGSSLGAIVLDADLPRFTSPEGVRRFVEGGRHHYGWLSWDVESARHVNLVGVLLRKHGSAAPAVAKAANLPDSTMEGILRFCAGFVDYPVRFSEERAAFVLEQVKARRAVLARYLGG